MHPRALEVRDALLFPRAGWEKTSYQMENPRAAATRLFRAEEEDGRKPASRRVTVITRPDVLCDLPPVFTWRFAAALTRGRARGRRKREMPGMLSLCKASPGPGAREEPRPTSRLSPGTGQSAFFSAAGCNVTLPRRATRPVRRTHPGGGPLCIPWTRTIMSCAISEHKVWPLQPFSSPPG